MVRPSRMVDLEFRGVHVWLKEVPAKAPVSIEGAVLCKIDEVIFY